MSDTDLTAPGTAAPSGLAATPEREVRSPLAKKLSPLARSSYAKATNEGYGTAMGRGIELTLTLAVMVGIGWVADRVAGTAPLFIITFSVLGFAGITAKLFIGYDLEMRQHEDGAIWNRGKTPSTATAVTDEPSSADPAEQTS